MGGDLYIDEGYHSGIDEFPGVRFVLNLRKSPLDFNDLMLDEYTMPMEACAKQPNVSSHKTGTAAETKTGTLRASVVAETPPESALAAKHTDSATTTASTTTPAPVTLPENLNVLFVDDDMVLRKLFTRSVRKVAPTWSISEASNGETSLTMATEKQYDLIFMDQYMASVQKQLLGTETTRALRSQGCQSFICGLSANDVQKPFLDAGASAFLMKPLPCKPDVLKAELGRLLAHFTKLEN